MDKSIVNVKNDNRLPSKLEVFLPIVLAAVMLAVFIEPQLSIVCGPIMAVIFTYLFFKGQKELVTAIILVANDALGTVLLGNISFQYLLLGLVLINMLTKASYSHRRIMFFLISLLFVVQFLYVGFGTTKMIVFSVIYILSLATIRFDGDRDSAKRFLSSVAYIVIIIALHAVITGGVEYYELSDRAIREGDVVRKGILGVGIGNSNFSAFLLVFGFTCLFCFTDFKPVIKVIASYPLLHALVLTRSMSGLLELIVVISLMLLLKKNKGTAVTILIVAILALVIAFQVYAVLPPEMHLPELDAYIERIGGKLFEFEVGDYSGATTQRTDLSASYMQYIFHDQGNLKMMFGGNPVIVKSISNAGTHNMYLNLLLQFGLIGAIAFIIYSVYRIGVCFKNKEDTQSKHYLVLKGLCIFASFGISLYLNNLWALWMLVMILL